MKRFAVLFVLLAAGCTSDGRQSAARDGDKAQSPGGPQQKMSSLRIATDSPADGAAASGNRQSMTVSGGAKGTQVQRGDGNTQSMNVQASGGNVSQNQSGSGNSQSMNIGVTDDPAGAVPAASGKQ
ncbi:MAG: hypothetical protein ABI831_23820 [Betaproteobacteria bacterium]